MNRIFDTFQISLDHTNLIVGSKNHDSNLINCAALLDSITDNTLQMTDNIQSSAVKQHITSQLSCLQSKSAFCMFLTHVVLMCQRR